VITHLIIGTAGHIDHGKTALVKALTGVDTDRLPDERRRGMTIDLGFAMLELPHVSSADHSTSGTFRLGIVDVPGHERFVRNMLAGAMAIDVAMLVIAATESIKPQTREHLEILHHAGLNHGIVVLTKCDLVDDGWISLVEDEVRDFVAASFLKNAPLVCVSSTKNVGIAQLRNSLAEVSQQAAASNRRHLKHSPFCMSIDRVFSIDGHGTVVTGSVVSGRLRVGDEVVISPRGITARVRALHSYNQSVATVERGQRAGINLAGVPRQELRRGDVVAEQGLLWTSQCLGVHVALSPEYVGKMRRNQSVRVHLGTAEVNAKLRWLQEPQASNHRSLSLTIAELRTEEPVACLAGQPLVIRSRCASQTLGGGRVLDPCMREGLRWSASDIVQLQRLASTDPGLRNAAALYLSGLAGFDEQEVARRAGFGLVLSNLSDKLIREHHAVSLQLVGNQEHLVHVDVLQRVAGRIERLLERMHQRNPLKAAFAVTSLQPIFSSVEVPGLADAVIGWMARSGRLICIPAGIALPNHTPRLTQAQQREYFRLIQTHRKRRWMPPLLDELVAQATAHRESIGKLVELGIAQSHLVRVTNQWCLHWEVEREMLQLLQSQFKDRAFTVHELGALLETSRKYSVPICEYLDRKGVTIRAGNTRRLQEATVERLSKPTAKLAQR
jgi:selenocysteine-specific elongation factor